MNRVIEFDETEALQPILDRLSILCARLDFPDVDLKAAEALARSIHADLQEMHGEGAQMNFKKEIRAGANTLTIIAVSSAQRRGLLNRLRRIFSR